MLKTINVHILRNYHTTLLNIVSWVYKDFIRNTISGYLLL
jgi:hypothetical protein